jgi:hypothetical protein
VLGGGSLQQSVEQRLEKLTPTQRLAPARRDRRGAIPQSSDAPCDTGRGVGVAPQSYRRLHDLLVGASVLRPARRIVGKATLTTVASRMTMKMPKMTENRMPHLFGDRCRMRNLPRPRAVWNAH